MYSLFTSERQKNTAIKAKKVQIEPPDTEVPLFIQENQQKLPTSYIFKSINNLGKVSTLRTYRKIYQYNASIVSVSFVSYLFLLLCSFPSTLSAVAPNVLAIAIVVASNELLTFFEA